MDHVQKPGRVLTRWTEFLFKNLIFKINSYLITERASKVLAR